jgi:hypothetical protein
MPRKLAHQTEKAAALQQKGSRSRKPKVKNVKGKKQALPSSSRESDNSSAAGSSEELAVHMDTYKKKLHTKPEKKHTRTKHAASEREDEEVLHIPRSSDEEVVVVSSRVELSDGGGSAELENSTNEGSDSKVCLL